MKSELLQKYLFGEDSLKQGRERFALRVTCRWNLICIHKCIWILKTMKLGVDLSFQYADATGNPALFRHCFIIAARFWKWKGSHSAIFQSLIQRKIICSQQRKTMELSSILWEAVSSVGRHWFRWHLAYWIKQVPSCNSQRRWGLQDSLGVKSSSSCLPGWGGVAFYQYHNKAIQSRDCWCSSCLYWFPFVSVADSASSRWPQLHSGPMDSQEYLSLHIERASLFSPLGPGKLLWLLQKWRHGWWGCVRRHDIASLWASLRTSALGHFLGGIWFC